MSEVGLPFLLCRWTIWAERVKALEKFVLDKWEHFTIWNAGKQGKQLYRSLSPSSRAKVQWFFRLPFSITEPACSPNTDIIPMCALLQVEAFCDVDAKKIARGHYIFEDSTVCEVVLTVVV